MLPISLGLRELFANPNRGDMPEEAANLIVSQSAEVEGDGWSASVLETYCDEGTVLVAVRVSADERYAVVPTEEDLNSPLSVIGLSGEESLREYAQKEGKTLLFVGANLDWEALGLSSAGERFENASPQEMTIYVEGARGNGAATPLIQSAQSLLWHGPQKRKTPTRWYRNEGSFPSRWSRAKARHWGFTRLLILMPSPASSWVS